MLFPCPQASPARGDAPEEWKKFHRLLNKCHPPDRPCESLCQADLFIKFTVGPSITLPYFASAGANTQIQARHPKSWEGRRCLGVIGRALWLLRGLADRKGEPGDLGRPSWELGGACNCGSFPGSSLPHTTAFPFRLLRPQKAETTSVSSPTATG